jgi:hypothetical protein
MQRQHAYPSHRFTPSCTWRALPQATADMPPLGARTAERTIRIRDVFLVAFGGFATIDQVGHACDQLGLLDGLNCPRDVVMRALRPLTTHRLDQGRRG